MKEYKEPIVEITIFTEDVVTTSENAYFVDGADLFSDQNKEFTN